MTGTAAHHECSDHRDGDEELASRSKPRRSMRRARSGRWAERGHQVAPRRDGLRPGAEVPRGHQGARLTSTQGRGPFELDPGDRCRGKGATSAVQHPVRRKGKNDRRSIRTLPRALVEQQRARFTSSVAALRAALSAENGFEISGASLRLLNEISDELNGTLALSPRSPPETAPERAIGRRRSRAQILHRACGDRALDRRARASPRHDARKAKPRSPRDDRGSGSTVGRHF
jgi:hypothetical protein